MTEDNFEEFLKKAAQSYNVPPARTPREDMWSAIQAQRAAGPRVVYGGGSPAGESSTRRFGPKIWLGAAAAAMLLLATGVGIGRWSSSSTPAGSITAVNPPAASSSPDSIDPQSNGGAPEVSRVVATGESGVGGGARSASIGGRSEREGSARSAPTAGAGKHRE